MVLDTAVRILILKGGNSPEREVSFRSASAVRSSLVKLGYTNIFEYDPIEGLDGLVNAARRVDVVLPIIHGENCEDGTIQELLEDAGVPFLGAGSKASRLAIRKDKTHEVLASLGIAMPEYAVVTQSSFADHKLSKKPFILKPIDGGSTIGCLIVRNINDFDSKKAIELLREHKNMLLEELVIGQEITVGVLDKSPLPIVAIIPPENAEFDYENKYNGATKELCPAPESLVLHEIQKNAQKLALTVHKSLGVRHLSRTDMIVKPNGDIIVLELNTIPGLTAQSLFPKEAASAGITMDMLVEQFVEMALAG